MNFTKNSTYVPQYGTWTVASPVIYGLIKEREQ